MKKNHLILSLFVLVINLQACKKDSQDIKIGYIDDRYWYLDSTVIVTGNTRVTNFVSQSNYYYLRFSDTRFSTQSSFAPPMGKLYQIEDNRIYFWDEGSTKDPDRFYTILRLNKYYFDFKETGSGQTKYNYFKTRF
jgi:hypothetical protein